MPPTVVSSVPPLGTAVGVIASWFRAQGSTGAVENARIVIATRIAERARIEAALAKLPEGGRVASSAA